MISLPLEIKYQIYLLCDFNLQEALKSRIINKEWQETIDYCITHMNLSREDRKRYFNRAHYLIYPYQATEKTCKILFPVNTPDKNIIDTINSIRFSYRNCKSNFVDECFMRMLKTGYAREARWMYYNLDAKVKNIRELPMILRKSVKRQDLEMMEFMLIDMNLVESIKPFLKYTSNIINIIDMLEKQKYMVGRLLLYLVKYSSDSSSDSD